MLVQDERKSATILFADIADSTSLVTEGDPEAALDLLRPALTLLSEGVKRYGGTVNRVTGDGLMAMFGAPFTDEEHALGACCAALEMHSALARAAPNVRLRIGVHSGDIVVHTLRVGAAESLDAAGETVHLAARLQQSAPPSSTWISDATFLLARGRIETRVVGAVSFRGFDAPVVVHLLQTADPSLSRLDVAGRRDLSPFVNREDEIAVLEDAYARAAEGKGCAVPLSGDAGVGKSRLIREFVAAHSGVRVLEARCTRWRDDSGFHAMRALTRRLFGFDNTENPAATHARLRMAFADPNTAPEEVLTPIAVLHGIAPPADWAALNPNARRRRIIEGCLAVLLREASDRPLLVVLDDVHWADTDTEEVIERLLDGLEDSRLLLILGWRSGYRPYWAGHPALVHVALSPLAPEHAQSLARSVLGARAINDVVVAELVDRTGGNPFFIEEAAAMPDMVIVPPTVRTLLGARLDRLTAKEKRFIEVLAAIEEPTSIDLLSMVLSADAHACDPGLLTTELEQEGLVRLDGVGESVRVACRHSLLQDVAYQGLTRGRRRTLHAQIATAMEQLAGDRAAEEAEVLARHARLGGAWEAALRYARLAGARAASHFANREAVRFYQEALEALTHQRENAEELSLGLDLRLALRDPLFRLGHIALLRTHLDEAAALAEKLGDTRRLGQVYLFQSHHAWLAGDYAAAIAAAGRATLLAELQGDTALKLRAVFQRALGQLGHGDLVASAAGMAEVAEWEKDPTLGGQFGIDAQLVVVALGYQTRALTDLQEFDAAEIVVASCMGRAAQVAEPFSSIFAEVARGYFLLSRGAASEAVTQLTEAAALCDQAEADLMRPVVQSFLGAAEAASGLVSKGLQRLEAAVETAAAMGFLFQQPLRLALLAEALSAAGRVEEAALRAAESQALGARQGEKIPALVKRIRRRQE